MIYIYLPNELSEDSISRVVWSAGRDICNDAAELLPKGCTVENDACLRESQPGSYDSGNEVQT